MASRTEMNAAAPKFVTGTAGENIIRGSQVRLAKPSRVWVNAISSAYADGTAAENTHKGDLITVKLKD